MKNNVIHRTNADKAFDTLDYILLTIAFLLVAYPLYFVVIASVSDPIAVYEGRVILYPIKPTLEGYRRILSYTSLFTGYKNTLVYTLVGTAINVTLTITAGYALSRKELVGRNVMMMGVMITMIVSGGMIPNYLLVRSLRLYNTMWALILPGAISTYNMIIIRTAFQSIPESLIESAQLDGANDVIVLFRIVIPLSKATLATMLLFYSVTHWNSYFDAMLYLNKKELYPLQIMLRNMLIGGLFNEETAIAGASADSFAVTDATLRSAAIIVTTLPILIVYPFVQRYFVKGVMIGSVKG